MGYTVNALAKIAGVSARTLRFYDQIGLLPPAGVAENGYRFYGEAQVRRLQQILLYREMDIPLDQVRALLTTSAYDEASALASHLDTLKVRRERLDTLIANVEKSINTIKGNTTMTDDERFEGFKQQLVNDNEARYGAEVRARYGDEIVDASNQKVMQMTPAQQAELERISAELSSTLQAAVAEGNPASPIAQQACALHRQWLSFYWPSYSPEAHAGLTQMYVDDSRFKAHYEAIAPGSAEFLRDAVSIYIQ